MTTWTAIVREAEEDLQAADREVDIAHAEVEQAQAALEAAMRRQAQMRSTVEWARRKQEAERPADELARVSFAAAVPEPTSRTGGAAAEKTLVERCEEALARFGRPVKTAEIKASINREGHDYSTSQIGSTLKYMADRRKPATVLKLGDGVWRLVNGAVGPGGSAAREYADPLLNGVGGRS